MFARDPSLRQANGSRYRGQRGGFYESYFLRASHPERPLSFWFRYTLFSPRHDPAGAEGELWGILFDGESGSPASVYRAFPMSRCSFSPVRLEVRIGEAGLREGELKGSVRDDRGTIAWDLHYSRKGTPLLFLPPLFYDLPFPRAKSLVGAPWAEFSGRIQVNGRNWPVERWKGSQGHNWGTSHTDEYVWAEAAGFDNAPETFLEAATARLKMGPVSLPSMTPILLRHEGHEIRATNPLQAMKACSRLSDGGWNFATETGNGTLEGRVAAPSETFVELFYRNPPGGSKRCRHSGLASCEVLLRDRARGIETRLRTPHGAALEFLSSN